MRWQNLTYSAMSYKYWSAATFPKMKSQALQRHAVLTEKKKKKTHHLMNGEAFSKIKASLINKECVVVLF